MGPDVHDRRATAPALPMPPVSTRDFTDTHFAAKCLEAREDSATRTGARKLQGARRCRGSPFSTLAVLPTRLRGLAHTRGWIHGCRGRREGQYRRTTCHRRARGGSRPAREGDMTGAEDAATPGRRSPAIPAGGLTEALEAIGTAAYVVDEEGSVLAVNAHAERLLVRPAEEFLGRDAHDLLHRDAHGHHLPRSRCDMRQAFHAGRTAQADGDYFECGDGSLLPVSWMITPYVVDGREAGTLVLVHAQRPPETARQPEAAPDVMPELERLALLAETTTRLTSTLDAE